MINRPIFAFLLHILMMDFAHSCDDFQRVVKSEIFPDGGSIGLKLESGCKSVHFVKYVKPLRGDEVLSLNGVAVLPGTKDEVLLIQRLDNLVKKAAKNKSLQNFQNAEMKRFVGGAEYAYAAICFGGRLMRQRSDTAF